MKSEEAYHAIPVEIENELNINAPEVHNGGDPVYKVQGFHCQEDLDRHLRRYDDRSKPAPVDPYKKGSV